MLTFKADLIAFENDSKEWTNALQCVPGTSKHTKNNAHKMVGMLMELLSETLKVEVKDDGRFSALETAGDIKGLFNLVEEKVCGVGDGTHPIQSFVTHLRMLFNGWQGHGQTLASYRETKDAQRAFVSRLNDGGVTIAPDFVVRMILGEQGKSDAEINKLEYGSDELLKAKKEAEERVLAFVYLYGANREKFGTAVTYLENKYSDAPDAEKNKVFKSSVSEALKFLNTWRVPRDGRRTPGNQEPGAQYHARGAVLKNAEGKVDEDAKIGCTHCGNPNGDSHHTSECGLLSIGQKKELGAVLSLAIERLGGGNEGESKLTQLLSSINGGDGNDPAARNALSSRILLDNCANVSSASSVLAPNSLRLSNKPTRVSCNAGFVDLDHDITYGGFDFKANDNSQENILSQGDLEDAGYRVQYDSNWGYYKVSKNGLTAKVYKDRRDGLPAFDITNLSPSDDFVLRNAVDEPVKELEAVSAQPKAAHVQTLRQTINESGLTKRQVADAERAYKYAERTGHKSQREAEYLVVSDPAFQKAGISLQDMKNAHVLFGPRISSLKGKTTRRAPGHVRTDYVAVPRDFLKLQKNVTLVVDVMFVNNLPFLITMSRNIRYVTVEHIKSRTVNRLCKGIIRVLRLYGRAGLTVQTAMMDLEFEPVKEPLLDKVVVNTSAAKEHVAEIERCIRTTKEKCRCTVSMLPFSVLPKLVVINIVYHEVMWTNAFPNKKGGIREFFPASSHLAQQP